MLKLRHLPVLVLSFLLLETTPTCTTTINVPGYICNSNGLLVRTQTSLSQTAGNTDQGAIAGIVIGWVFGATAVYLLGLWLIFYCFRKKYDRERKEADSHEDDGRRIKTTEEGMVGTVPPGYPEQTKSKYMTRHRKEV